MTEGERGRIKGKNGRSKRKDTLELGGELRLSNAMDDGEGVLPLSEVLTEALVLCVLEEGEGNDVTSRLEYIQGIASAHIVSAT